MPGDREVLVSMLQEASRQSEAFQSLIHDYSLDVMGDAEVHHFFARRLNADAALLRRIGHLKTLLGSTPDACALTAPMQEVLEAASALPASCHTNAGEIASLVAAELAYRRMDQGIDPPLASERTEGTRE